MTGAAWIEYLQGPELFGVMQSSSSLVWNLTNFSFHSCGHMPDFSMMDESERERRNEQHDCEKTCRGQKDLMLG